MTRHAAVLAVLVGLTGILGCARHRSLQPLSTPSTQAALADAARLDALIRQLSGEGRLQEAIPLAERSLALREKALGSRHSEVAISLDVLAMIYRAQGAYAKAEPLYRRALDLRERALGAMHPDVAQSLDHLAALYQAQGAYEKAEPLYRRALDIRENALGALHPAVARSLHNLAGIYLAQGAYGKAEPLLIRALDILEKVMGVMHPEVAGSLDKLATLYQAQGTYAKAESLYLRSLEDHGQAPWSMHASAAPTLDAIALSYRARDEYAKAEPLWVRALDIREQALGAMHPAVAQSLHNLAELCRAQGMYAQAESLLARAAEIREAQLRLELVGLSGPRRRALMMLAERETGRLVSLHADAMPSSQHALELALTTVLRRKGRDLDALAGSQLGLRAHVPPALRDELDQLAAARTELSTRLRARFDPRIAARRASAVTALRTRIADLEATLSAAYAEFRAQSEPVTIAKIQAALPPGAALVEFVRYRRDDPREIQPRQEERYVAYVLPSQGPPQWVALGEATLVDAGVTAVLAAMHQGTSPDATRSVLQRLDTLLFAPLRGPLTNVSHVILSPDSQLNLVPFEALVDPQGRYELESRLVSYVTSGRDLLRLATRRAPRSPATFVAAPDYSPSRALDVVATIRQLDRATTEIAALPAYFARARTLTGYQATKAALATTVGPAVLHIATHGRHACDAAATPTTSSKHPGSWVFSTPPAFSWPLDPRGIHADGAELSPLPPPPPSEDPINPLDHVGLAPAAANAHPERIVSARELASYDWWGTQLVVLPACETGADAVPSAEGVYGIRRTLVLSGAESQVVSLWNISNSSTRELMRAFYGELARGTGRAEALRRAKLQLLRQPSFAPPYYWAAFIPAGDWTPLDPHLLKLQEYDR
jgi:CHAT domain-containing protein